MRGRRLVTAAALAAALLAGCGGGGSSDDADPAPEPAADQAAETTTETTTPPGDDADVAATTTTPESDEPHPSLAGEPAFAELGDPTIALLNDESGNGPRPQLRWSPVDGATSYRVLVLAPDGQPYWAWEGPETEVAFGGPVPLDDTSAGPQLSTGMRWYVVAGDDDGGVPIAQSAVVRLEP